MGSTRVAVGLLALLGGAACSSSPAPTGSDAETDSAADASVGEGSAKVADPDTWNNYAKAFFATYCVSCHNGTTQVQNFNDYSQVKALTSTIRCGVAPVLESGCSDSPYPPKQFPIGSGPKPTDAERDRMVAWINAGAPED
jgi:hypothetical protein